MRKLKIKYQIPKIKPKIKNQKPKIKVFQTARDPLYEIKQLMRQYKFGPVKGLPRFCGGFVGYIG
ncbi:MAG: hypothetical protein HY589_02570, partial [Candidatus Omnitrophica bacterium]|nr:hypothetical protein [Candidatus Omnitrophota bacterium]